MKVKEESEKVGLNVSIQKTKIMASGLITPWQIDGETVETVSDFIFLGSKITAEGDCSHEIKRCLLLGRKVMTNLDRSPTRDQTQAPCIGRWTRDQWTTREIPLHHSFGRPLLALISVQIYLSIDVSISPPDWVFEKAMSFHWCLCPYPWHKL